MRERLTKTQKVVLIIHLCIFTAGLYTHNFFRWQVLEQIKLILMYQRSRNNDKLNFTKLLKNTNFFICSSKAYLRTDCVSFNFRMNFYLLSFLNN